MMFFIDIGKEENKQQTLSQKKRSNQHNFSFSSFFKSKIRLKKQIDDFRFIQRIKFYLNSV